MAKSFPAKTTWCGISVTTPDDWGLAAASGENDKGYLRVDSPMATIAEIRWSAAKTAPDLASRAHQLLGTLRTAAKKHKIEFTSKVDVKKDAAPDTPVKFTWKADRNGYGRATYCERCGRVLVAQVSSPRNESILSLANEILDSITDHGEDDWTEWALFGVRTAVPPGFALVKQTLLSGYFSLEFKSRFGDLVVQQWGLAGSILKKSALAEWYGRDVLGNLKHFEAGLEPVEDAEHETLRIVGRRSGIVQKIKTLAMSLTLVPLPVTMSGFVWLCPDSNRIVAIRLVHRDSSLAEKIRERTKCHGQMQNGK